MSSDSRLVRAMDVYLECKAHGIDRERAVAEHPDLGELLGLLWADDSGAVDDDTTPGEATFGPYRIVRELGRGGMGVVYEASQNSLGRRVALKVLGTGASPTPTQVARFRREATTLARLDHAGVVRVHDVGETAGRHWLAMELVDGRSLAERLDELRAAGGHRGPSLRHLVECIADVAEALHHVHAAGILHRDVKPSNVLLRADGRALLSDFGLAHDAAAPTMTQLGVLVGTPNYMSPEQASGAAGVSPASDVFSLGATLYECITLRRPFDGSTNEAVLRQILLHDPVDPRRVQPGLPADLAAIVLKAIEKDPSRRYATADAFAADLRAFLELKPVQARPPSTVHRLRRWARREPWRAALAASLLVCVALGAWAVAQVPDLRAAAAARAQAEYEDAISMGWLQRSSNQRDASLAAFRRAVELRPRSSEAIAGLGLALRQFDGIDAALAEFARPRSQVDDAELLVRARALALQVAGRTAESDALFSELPPPRTAVDFWFTGTAKLVGSRRGSAEARAALEQISLAARMSPQPRLTLFVQWTIAAEHAGDHDVMREGWQALLRLWPEHPIALHYAAVALTASDLERSLQLLRDARARGMDPRESHILEAMVLQRLGRHDELLDAAKAALAFRWDDGRRSQLIRVLGQLGDRDAESAAVNAWVAEAPDNANAISHLAMLRSYADEHDAAIDLFARAAALQPDDAEAAHRVAVAQSVAGRDDDARATLTKVVERAPLHERAHVLALDLARAAGDDAGVLAELRRWAAARGEDAGAWREVAKALFDSVPPRLEEALAAISTADYAARGKDAAVLALRAEIHDALGEHGAARRCRERAAGGSPR